MHGWGYERLVSEEGSPSFPVTHLCSAHQAREENIAHWCVFDHRADHFPSSLQPCLFFVTVTAVNTDNFIQMPRCVLLQNT